MTTKTADGKGRIALGPQFANKTFIVKVVDDMEIHIISAVVIPQREMWLSKNAAAMKSVQRGLHQAATDSVTKIDPHEDDALLGELDGCIHGPSF